MYIIKLYTPRGAHLGARLFQGPETRRDPNGYVQCVIIKIPESCFFLFKKIVCKLFKIYIGETL